MDEDKCCSTETDGQVDRQRVSEVRYPATPDYVRFARVTRIVWLVLISPVCSTGDQVLFDFDRRPLSKDWTAVGDVQAERRPLSKYDRVVHHGPVGKGVRITAQSSSGLFTKARIVPRDWSSFAQINFWVFRSEDEVRRKPKLVMEVQIVESDQRARFWRRVELSHAGWKQIQLPLRWFRWGDGRVPRWTEVAGIGFWLREASELAIDSISIVNIPGHSAFLNIDDLEQTGFPNADLTCQVIKAPELTLLTDVQQLDVEQLTGHLRKVDKACSQDFDFAAPSRRVPTLVLFSSREQYQAFTPRFAQRFNSSASRPQSSGYTVQGISTSYWDPAYGTLRPVYTHEFIHGFLVHRIRLPSEGGWLHEGLASYYQLAFHQQENLNELVQAGLLDANRRTPLQELCNGQKILSSRYWQAMTVVRLLLHDAAYRDRFPRLIEAFQAPRVNGP